MARITKGKTKLCRRERYDLYPRLNDQSQVSKRLRKTMAPGEHPIHSPLSQYGLQLREKQKVKRMYGLMERQFRRFFRMASKSKEQTGLALLRLLELRLDNFLFRAGMAKTRDQARQLVNHGHVRVNGKKVDIPSYILKIGDEVKLIEKITRLDWYDEIKKISEVYEAPSWIEKISFDVAVVRSLPERDHIDKLINEQYIVELYSK